MLVSFLVPLPFVSHLPFNINKVLAEGPLRLGVGRFVNKLGPDGWGIAIAIDGATLLSNFTKAIVPAVP